MSLLGVARQYRNQANAFVVFDAGVSEFRKRLNPSYKMERKEKKPDKPLPDISTASQFIHAVNQIAGIPSFMDTEIEGDDFINALLKFLVPEGGYSIIVSSDKDFYQVLSDKKKVLMYDPIKKEYVTEKSVIEMGFDPDCWRDQYIIFRSITGDKDEVPKIMKGLGPSRALPIAKTLCYGCRSSSKYADVVFESLDQVETNISLFDLDVAFFAIKEQVCSILRGYVPPQKPSLDRMRFVSAAFSKWELKEISSRSSDIVHLARRVPIAC
jgi:5'-3' exonuclease